MPDVGPVPPVLRDADATTGTEPVLRLRDVTLRYAAADRAVTAIRRVSFDVHEGDRLVLLGPSGCGKSSLLKAVGGFIRPDEGIMTLNGREIARPGPDRMMVFQDFEQLLPWKTVIGNVASPMLVSRRWRRSEALERAHEALAKVGLTRWADVYPHTLSGGMKQRVAIARAMVMEPEILLMDEPYASLDALTRRTMQQELLRLWEDVPLTLLFVTHSIEEAILIGSRIIVLSSHPGSIRAEFGCGAPHGESSHSLQAKISDLLFTSDGDQLCG
ncbi:MAG TPA: ABC transporter ATP-binding protein [Acetobacteraceae bacterium]|nr:ABC transporter ATP-binding protein [Acetobacteraceae bacterium]